MSQLHLRCYSCGSLLVHLQRQAWQPSTTTLVNLLGLQHLLTLPLCAQWQTLGGVHVDTGANASAEEAEEGVEDTDRKVVDIIESFRLVVRTLVMRSVCEACCSAGCSGACCGGSRTEACLSLLWAVCSTGC